MSLTHWGRVTHICIGNLNTIDSEDGFSPSWRQAIIWTNAGLLLIGPNLETNFSEILNKIQTFSLKKMHLKMPAKWWPFCLGLNVLNLKDEGLFLENPCRISYNHNLCANYWPEITFIQLHVWYGNHLHCALKIQLLELK